MSLLNIFTSSNIALAMAIYALLACVEPFFDAKLRKIVAKDAAAHWFWEQFFAPLARALMLMAFVYCAYPTIFGLREAPSVSMLMASEEFRISAILGAVFVVGFVATFMPGFSRNPVYILPLQACLVCGYLFFALCAYLSITTATLWPGIDIALMMLLVSYLGHRFGRFAGRHFGSHLDGKLNTRGCDALMIHAMDLLAQMPVVILFGYGLGRQLAI